MAGLKKIMINELKALNHLRNAFEKEEKNLPKGSLQITVVKGHKYLRAQNEFNRINLSMDNESHIRLAQKLRRKRYLQKMLKIIDNNIAVLEKATKKYIEFEPNKISDSLSLAYQIPPGKEKEAEDYFESRPSSDYIFRSKSEQIIALVLESNGFEIMYEKEEYINRKEYRPDFTFRDPETGQLIYYEHFGLSDNPGYYEKSIVEKLMDYWYEGIRLGENLIITFETKDDPLTAGRVQSALDSFFGKSC
jgi:hypothetical protein